MTTPHYRPDMVNPSQRLRTIDALRGIAAVFVLLAHSGSIWGDAGEFSGVQLYHQITQWGWSLGCGVDIFFVISGFVIAHSVSNRAVDTEYVGRFILRRSIRLDPPYWIAIAYGVLVVLFHRAISGREQIEVSWQAILAHVLYIQGIAGYPHIIGVFWTLCLEIQFYLLFILIAWLSTWVGRKSALPVLTLVALVVSLAWPAKLLSEWWTLKIEYEANWFVWHWHKFLLGAVIALVCRSQLAFRTGWCSVVAVAVAYAVGGSKGSSSGYFGSSHEWMTIAVAVFLLIGIRNDALDRWLTWRCLLNAGAISYSLYLFHLPLVQLALGFQRRLPVAEVVKPFIVYPLTLAGALVLAYAMYRLVESPSHHLSRRVTLKSREPASLTPSAATYGPSAVDESNVHSVGR